MSKHKRTLPTVAILLLVLPLLVSAAETVAPGPAAKVDDALFPPKPDFKTEVDYLQWLKGRIPGPVKDNAFDAYKTFMSMATEKGADKTPPWPELNDMFNGKRPAPPAPWNPGEHPDWEKTHKAVQPLLGQFWQAASYDRYVEPLVLGPAGDRGDGPVLAGILLPGLGQHRAIVKASLADAWRAENGRVVSTQMLASLKTSLRAANHMEQGTSLIHRLVGVAEKQFIRENACWALWYKVFSTADELKQVLDVLKKCDPQATIPPAWLPLEAGMTMERAQYVFMPVGSDGQPRINRDRVGRVLRADGNEQDAGRDKLLNRVAALKPSDARKTAEALDRCFREILQQWCVGYPRVRVADIKAIEDRYRPTNALTGLLIPSLGRPYQFMARNEASRRATQLVYAVYLFKAQNGRWPASLSDLPAECGDTIRTDPFSGKTFGYRVSADGPTVYSLGENGIDDGGVHAKRWGDEKKSERESDDYVFWPPQK